MRWISNFFRNLWKLIDKKIVVPITKLILYVTEQFEKSGKRVEKWLSKSTTLLFISLFLAIVMFIIVDQKVLLFSENSAEVLKKQPVNVIYNEEAYVIEGLPSTVDVTLIGRKADLYFAKQSPSNDINVDLSGLKPGTHKVNIKYNQVLPSIDYKVNPSVATVIIYPKVSETRTLTLDVLNQDSLDSKLVIKDINIDSDKVVIKGAEHVLSNVATVKGLVDVKKLVTQEVGTIELKDVMLKAYDDNGNVVKNVEIVPNKIDAEVEITSPSKELPIKVIPKGDVSFGKAIKSIELSDTKVTVYGSEEVLADLKSVPVEVDVKDLKEDREYKLSLKKPVGVNAMSVNNVTVGITLGDSVDKEISGINIEYRNLNDNYAVQGISQEDTRVSVIVKGVSTVINSIRTEDVVAYLDLKGYGEGEHEVAVEVDQTDSRVQYVPKTKKVKIRIVRK